MSAAGAALTIGVASLAAAADDDVEVAEPVAEMSNALWLGVGSEGSSTRGSEVVITMRILPLPFSTFVTVSMARLIRDRWLAVFAFASAALKCRNKRSRFFWRFVVIAET